MFRYIWEHKKTRFAPALDLSNFSEVHFLEMIVVLIFPAELAWGNIGYLFEVPGKGINTIITAFFSFYEL